MKQKFYQINFQKISFFLPSFGCEKAKKFGPCTMCVFSKPWKIVSYNPKKLDYDLILKIYRAEIIPLINKKHLEILQFLIGGSTLNPQEFSFSALKRICKNLPACIERLELESRPEDVNSKIINEIKKVLPKKVTLVVYLGVETFDDKYRNEILKKRIYNKDIFKALKILKEQKILVGAYILAGLPGMFSDESVKNAIQSVKWCFKQGFDSVALNPTKIPNARLTNKKQKEFFANFQPLSSNDLNKILAKTKKYPVKIAQVKNDPPQQNNKFFIERKKIIAQKITRTLGGDIKAFASFYNIPAYEYQKEIIPILFRVQTLVYYADFIVEESSETSREINSDLENIFVNLIKYLKTEKIYSKELEKLFVNVWEFLQKDRTVHIFYQKKENHVKPFCKNKAEIFATLNSKVSDLVALMLITAEIGKSKINPEEWKIWRQIEFVREFFDDWEDRAEDCDKNHEQFNSIIQMRKLKLDIKTIIKDECQKLLRMIAEIQDKEKRKNFQQIYQSRVANWAKSKEYFGCEL